MLNYLIKYNSGIIRHIKKFEDVDYKSDTLQRMNTSLLVNHVREEVEGYVTSCIENHIFESNDSHTRLQIEHEINYYLNEIRNRRAVADYDVHVREGNEPNTIVIDISIRPPQSEVPIHFSVEAS